MVVYGDMFYPCFTAVSEVGKQKHKKHDYNKHCI